MSEASHLAAALEGLFSAHECLWFVTYPAAVEELTAPQAASSPGPRFNSVWGVTLHLSLCQRFALAMLRGETVEVNEFFAAGAWPPVRDPGDEVAWQQAKRDVLAVNHALVECVAGLSGADLDKELAPVGMKAYQYVQGHLAHNSNHLCEIVATRHMQGLWLEKT
jgi:DinB superfamily